MRGRPTGVVKQGVVKQCPSTVVVKQCRPTVVVQQWSYNRGRQTRGRQTVSSNSGRQQWSSNSGHPTVVVQQGSSNKGSSNSVVQQCSSTVIVQQGSSNKGSSNSVIQQWLSTVNSGRPTVVSSSKLTTHDLQLRNVISPSFELRFGCSWTSWKAHCVQFP